MSFESKTISIRCVYQCNPHLLRKTHVSFFDKIRKKKPEHIVPVQADSNAVARKRLKDYLLHIFLHIRASKQLTTSLRSIKWQRREG